MIDREKRNQVATTIEHFLSRKIHNEQMTASLEEIHSSENDKCIRAIVSSLAMGFESDWGKNWIPKPFFYSYDDKETRDMLQQIIAFLISDEIYKWPSPYQKFKAWLTRNPKYKKLNEDAWPFANQYDCKNT